MSNFTTFFPSGGGGEGSGINSYAPFLVTSSNNPSGYNSTTGLYTNPIDESVWLKTGNTLASTLATYPNATSVESNSVVSNVGVTNVSATGTMRSTTSSLSQLRWYRAYSSPTVNIDVIDMATSNTIQTIDTSAGTTGDVWNLQGIALSYDESEIIALITIRDTPAGISLGKYIMKFSTSTFAQTQAPVAVSGGFVNQNGSIVNIGSTSYFFDTGNDFKEINISTGIFTGTTITPPTTPIGIASDGTNLWYLHSSNYIWYQITTAGVATGLTFQAASNNDLSMLPITNGFRTLEKSGSAPDNKTWDIANSFGDGTARTDASGSGQPLFIKLK